MRLNYKFFDSEATEPVIVKYDLPTPFYENLERELKDEFGEELTFVRLIDHQSRVIRLHSAYDSGKGTTIIPPRKPRPPRKPINKVLEDIFKEQGESKILELKQDGYVNMVLIFHRKLIQVFSDARVNTESMSVSGYSIITLEPETKAIIRYIRKKKYYPHQYKWYDSQ